MRKVSLEQLLVTRGLSENSLNAQHSIQEGLIRVDGKVVTKPAQMVSVKSRVEVTSNLEFVSGGGLKLKAALDEFAINPKTRICADVGASTGGFTDCLLQRGAQKIYAIDVLKDELHPKLQALPEVVVMDRTNARLLKTLPEPVSLIAIDVSFISLDFILPVVMGWFKGQPGEVIALVKPQFEAERELVKKQKGVIHERAVHAQVLEQILGFSLKLGYCISGLMPSPIAGLDGNDEFLLWLTKNQPNTSVELSAAIDQALARVSY
ncbi:MAG: TlyA family RNA methyltransferase [Anaerolineaceae bacterium]|jgi:23S rRNA (cytidine1920-2'-O)/16S rRNA (cytidine1409-2'-O)-methyltransferase